MHSLSNLSPLAEFWRQHACHNMHAPQGFCRIHIPLNKWVAHIYILLGPVSYALQGDVCMDTVKSWSYVRPGKAIIRALANGWKVTSPACPFWGHKHNGTGSWQNCCNLPDHVAPQVKAAVNKKKELLYHSPPKKDVTSTEKWGVLFSSFTWLHDYCQKQLTQPITCLQKQPEILHTACKHKRGPSHTLSI